MNYQPYANFDTVPLEFRKRDLYDKGNGIPQLSEKNMTIFDLSKNALFLKKDNPINHDLIMQTALINLMVDSPLSKLYYSDENIKRVQNMIKREIYLKTCGKYKMIVDQDVKNIIIAMSGIYKEHATYKPGEIVRQVKMLNQKVVEEVVPGMLVKIRFQQKYLKDISEPIDPIPLPVNVNNGGRNNLPSITTLWR